MYRNIKIFCLIIILSSSFLAKSHAVPVAPFKKFFQEIIEIFGSKTKDVMKQGNKADDTISGSVSKNIDDARSAIKDEDLIISKIGEDTHSIHYNEAINQPSSKISSSHGIPKISKEVLGESDNLLDLFDFGFRESEENIKIAQYILKSWSGKIYRVSEYFSRPNKDDRYLIVCKNSVEIFYFTILLNNKNDINRAYLTDHKFINSDLKSFEKQELLVFLDKDNVKVMGTIPESNNTFPYHYFTIYSDQYFKYDKYNDPKIIIEAAIKNNVLKSSENKCYKSKKDGIYLG